MIEYIPYVLAHLNKRVGAASFIYVVCVNNKTLINNEEIVSMIIEAALDACISFNINAICQTTISIFGKANIFS
jgi:hypothetical protein